MPLTLPPLQPNDIVEIRFHYELFQQQCFNVFHYRVPADYTPTGITVEHCCDAAEVSLWDTIATDGIRQASSVDLFLREIVCQVVHPYRGIAFPKVPDNQGGVALGNACPPSVAVVIRKKGVNAGKHYQGRLFLPGCSEANEAGGKLTNAGIAAYQATADRMDDPILVLHEDDTVEIEPVIYNQFDPSASKGVFIGQLTSVLRQQRRRELGVGI